jgi:hypothetical protein
MSELMKILQAQRRSDAVNNYASADLFLQIVAQVHGRLAMEPGFEGLGADPRPVGARNARNADVAVVHVLGGHELDLAITCKGTKQWMPMSQGPADAVVLVQSFMAFNSIFLAASSQSLPLSPFSLADIR